MRLFQWIMIGGMAFMSAATGAAADPHIERGARIFEQCANCHTLNEGGRTIYGPNLYGIIGRGIAIMPDFPYSPALRDQGGVWTLKKLNAFLARPQMAVKGTHMTFKGVLNPHDREDLIAWLGAVQQGNAPGPATDLISQILAKGDAERGERLFRPCTVCHTHTLGAGNKIGPNLYGVVGRRVASAPGFAYSKRLRERGGFWTPDTLNGFITENKPFAQGSHLAFKKLQKPADRADVIAYLKEISPNHPRGDSGDHDGDTKSRP